MALPYPDDPAVILAAGPFTSSSEGYSLEGEVLVQPQFTTAVHDADGGVISATDLRVPLVGGSMSEVFLASDPAGYSRLVDGVRVPLVFTYKVTVTLRDREGRQVPAPDPAYVVLASATTRQDLDILRPVGRDQGILVVRPSVESIAGLSGHITAEQVVALIGPVALADALTRALGDRFSPTTTAVGAAAVDAVQSAPTLNPNGRWDFAYPPTVDGQPLAPESAAAGPSPVLVLDDGAPVPAATAPATLIVHRPPADGGPWSLAGVWDGNATVVLRTSGSGTI